MTNSPSASCSLISTPAGNMWQPVVEMIGRNWGTAILGGNSREDMMI